MYKIEYVESIKEDLSLSDTQVGLLTGIAFEVCYAVFSLPLARVSDRGSPRFVLVSCALVWSAMPAAISPARNVLPVCSLNAESSRQRAWTHYRSRFFGHQCFCLFYISRI